MKPWIRILARTALIALFLGAPLLAQESGEFGPAPKQSPQVKVQPAAKKPHGSRRKQPDSPKVKLVDINSAGKDELKTLPGINGDLADRIILNRPYLSKAFLVTKNVLPMGTFQALRTRIIAVQKGTQAK